MKFRIIFSCLLVAITTVVWTGCTKEGPQGPAGLNTDIIASPWYTSPNIWSGQTGDWYFDVSNTAITKDIVENGVILAYVSLAGDVYNDYTWRPLPAYALNYNWDFLLPSSDGQTYGTIEFTSDMVNNPGNLGYFRFVLIPSNYTLKSARLKSTSASDLKKMPYPEVCKLLGIQE